MPIFRRFFARLDSRWPRRVAALALLALQGGIAASPLLELRGERTMGVHVEASGARHIDVHSESTCALCAARSLHAVASAPPEPELGAAPRMVVAAIRAGAPVSAGSTRTLRSRAPPAIA
jgi:hypothetical protein